MKRLITALVSCVLLLTSTLISAPASPYQSTVTNHDGTQLNIKVNGDEFCHWVTSEDGYTLLKDEQGNYQYAVASDDGFLKLSGVKASNLQLRTTSELQFLNNIKPNAGYNPETIPKIRQNSAFINSNAGSKMGGFPATGTKKLLMILANFSDTNTSYTQTNFNNYMNQTNYNNTGSFKDYYLENSYGKLTVNTTVQTWVKLSKTKAYYGPEAKWAEFVRDAVNAANAAGVDFTQYDNNADGILDGVAVIHQGLGQEETGNTSDIWSHNFDLRSAGITLSVDGKKVGPYTCQPEKSGSGMASIGVMCHEFGHNLGLPDFYDTDYATGGSYDGTGNWDMMASGSYNNYGTKPAHHNAWSKIFLNWATATTISSAAKITVRNSVANPDFFRVNTTTTNEYFLLENRQKTGFDSYLPGSGLIIYRVDGSYISSHMNANNINATSHQGFYPRAASSTINSAGCPFPGSGNKTSFTDLTTPNSKSWAGANTAKPITNIAVASGIVTFDFMGGGTVVTPGTTLINEGFEGTTFPPTGWTLGSTSAWSKGSEAYAGTKCARALYNPAGTKILNAPAVTIPANSTATLEFWWKNDDINAKIVKYDTTFCEISTNGTTWTRLGFLSATAAQTAYSKFTANVSAYVGTAVKIRWRFKTDGSNSAYGVGLDEVKLSTVAKMTAKTTEVGGTITNFPNPFNPTTTISFDLNSASEVKLAVYNAKGETVKVLKEGLVDAGTHSVSFDGSSLNSGMYFYTLSTPNSTLKGKMLLIK